MKATLHTFMWFVVYALVGSAEAGSILVALSDGEATLFLAYIFAPVAGLACGLIGIPAAFMIRRRAYQLTAWITIVALIAIASVMLMVLAH